MTDPEVLILDEAIKRGDTVTESKIQYAMEAVGELGCWLPEHWKPSSRRSDYCLKDGEVINVATTMNLKLGGFTQNSITINLFWIRKSCPMGSFFLSKNSLSRPLKTY